MTIFISVNKHSKRGRIQHYHYFAATKQRNQTKNSHVHETQTFFLIVEIDIFQPQFYV